MSTDDGRTASETEARLLVLHTLRLAGFVKAEAIAVRTNLPASVIDHVLTGAVQSGLVIERTGRITGWSLTSAGRAEHARLLKGELDDTGAHAAVEAANAAFLELNEPFKTVCSRWQMLPDGSLNDHNDGTYDAAVIDELDLVHERAVALTTELARTLPRFARYPRSFEAARLRLGRGDKRAFAAPLSESYHDAWMELHQDLLSTLARERSAADGH